MTPWIRWIGILQRKVRNLTFDLRYGGYVGGGHANTHPGANAVVHTDYRLMPQIFGDRIRNDDVLVDVGCGYGRVINWWLDQGHKGPIFGLELMADVAAHTRRRLSQFKNVTILTGDAIHNIPLNANIIFLFNPFNCPEIMRRFFDRLTIITEQRSNLLVLYYSPVLLDVIKENSRWNVEEIILSLPEFTIYEDRHRHLAVIRPLTKI